MFDASKALYTQERPEASVVGLVLLVVSIGAMYWLARAKRRAAAALKSRALEADSFQTSACFWLSIIGLGGVGLNAAFGLWWADPVAALGIAVMLVKEGRQGLRGTRGASARCGACQCPLRAGGPLPPAVRRREPRRGVRGGTTRHSSRRCCRGCSR